MKRRPVAVVIIILMPLLIAAYLLFYFPNRFEGDRFIVVSKGESFAQVADRLDSAGILGSRLFFDLGGRILGYTKKMQIGKYRFKSGMSNIDILKDIEAGMTVETITVPIPEGLRATRQAHILHRLLGIDSSRFMDLVHDSSLSRKLGLEAKSLAGFLMPRTYKFYWQTDEEDVIKTLVGEFWKLMNDSLLNQIKARGLSVNSIITMASIVEMETAIDSERPIIAGVYYNRLQKGMLLQADPTIQYLLEEGPRRLHLSDLEMESAYNTYKHRGLPPGPINNPGRASIMAAIRPARHKYLFFVANGRGGHSFSRTYSEHQRAVKYYRKLKKQPTQA